MHLNDRQRVLCIARKHYATSFESVNVFLCINPLNIGPNVMTFRIIRPVRQIPAQNRT
jgi:hypothetical protein